MYRTGFGFGRSLSLLVALTGFAGCRAIPGPAGPVGPVTAQAREQLATAKYVYLSSERKSGAWSAPAEIWFMWEQGSVWVGTKPTSWRVRRVNAGRKKARIAIGKGDGPAFEATGELVKDPALQAQLMETFARKYPDGWPKYEAGFREGFKTGERVLVRYTPR